MNVALLKASTEGLEQPLCKFMLFKKVQKSIVPANRNVPNQSPICLRTFEISS